MNRTERNVIRWALMVGALAGMVACAHGPAPVADQAETVGQLAGGSSVYSAPVHESTPPPSETYAVRARRERQAAKAKAVDAPDVEEKSAHGF